MESLENIDEEADIYGIDFVKNDDPHAARHFHIYNTPALVGICANIVYLISIFTIYYSYLQHTGLGRYLQNYFIPTTIHRLC